MLMQKDSTSKKKTKVSKSSFTVGGFELHPQEKTIKTILQFASSYRVQKVNNTQFIALNLN